MGSELAAEPSSGMTVKPSISKPALVTICWPLFSSSKLNGSEAMRSIENSISSSAMAIFSSETLDLEVRYCS